MSHPNHVNYTDHASYASNTNYATWRQVTSLVIVIALITVAMMLLNGCGTQTQTPEKDKGNSANSVAQLAAAPFVPTDAPTVTALSTVVSTETTTSSASVTPDLSATPNYLTPMVATHEAYATRVRGNREALGTLVALTHAPTDTPGEPPDYPSPTPMLGMLPGCSNASPYGPQGISCWRGVINGQLVEVAAGRQGLDGDPTQGIVKVHIRGQEAEDIYQTPNRVGAIRVVSVSGTLVTLSTTGQPTPQVFEFDLATRQWVSP